MNITLVSIAVLVLAVIGGLVAFGRRERKAGRDDERSDTQKEVIDGMAEVNAARVATADSSGERLKRMRVRFTRE